MMLLTTWVEAIILQILLIDGVVYYNKYTKLLYIYTLSKQNNIQLELLCSEV